MDSNLILKQMYAKEHGITLEEVDLEIDKQMCMSKHKYSIWQDKDGVWSTYLPIAKGKRKIIRIKDKDKFDKKMIEFYKQKNEVNTFAEGFIEWKQSQTDLKISPNTIMKYESDYKRFF